MRNKLSNDEINRILQQLDCEENNSDIDVDFVISAEEDNERQEQDNDIEQQMEVDAEVNASAIDPNDELMHHDISAMGNWERQKLNQKYLLPIRGRE